MSETNTTCVACGDCDASCKCCETREAWDPKLIGGWKGFVRKLYGHHKPSGGALILRIALGLLFIMEGWNKFMDLGGTIKFFGSLGFNGPAGWVCLVACAELLGGILILVGLLTKPACVALATEMAIIVWGLPAPHGGLFWGHSFEFFLLLALLSLYIGGPGKYSLARLWLNRKGKA
jgi:putative oxidoreductase